MRTMPRLFVPTTICFTLLTGCVAWRSAPPLPVRYSVPRGPQLVVNSDFKLPEENRLLDELEKLRGHVSRTLELPVSEQPIQIYLFKSGKVYRRFLKKHFPDFPKRRAFFVRRQDELAVYAHYSDRVAEDLRHEVSHGYLHSVVKHVPLWLDEGLAEYFEIPREKNGNHSQHVNEIITALKRTESDAPWHPNLARLESLVSAGQMEQMDYAESWAWIHWLLESTPERREALQEYLREARKGGKPGKLSKWLTERGLELNEDRLVEYVRGLNVQSAR